MAIHVRASSQNMLRFVMHLVILTAVDEQQACTETTERGKQVCSSSSCLQACFCPLGPAALGALPASTPAGVRRLCRRPPRQRSCQAGVADAVRICLRAGCVCACAVAGACNDAIRRGCRQRVRSAAGRVQQLRRYLRSCDSVR